MKLRRFIFIAVGWLCVTLAVVGIFVPVLPTTPFLLLAAFLFARSSDRFYHWLMTNRWFGDYIRNYREGRGIPRREKILAIFALWVTIIFAGGFVTTSWWARFLLAAVAVGVTAHLLHIKTYHPGADRLETEIQPASKPIQVDQE